MYILDLIFLSDHFPTEETKTAVLDGISDHKIVTCTVPVLEKTFRSQRTITFPDFSSADDTSIIDYLDYEFPRFKELSGHNVDINNLWEKFKDIASHCIGSYVPKKTKITRKHNPWITREVIHAKRKVKRLRKSVKQKATSSAKSNLITAIRDMRTKIRQLKQNTLQKYYLRSLKVHLGNFGITLALINVTVISLHSKETRSQQIRLMTTSNQYLLSMTITP